MEDQNKKIWKMLDGQLSPEEEEALRQKLEVEPELQQTFEEAKTLDLELKQMEANEPSMRFSKNILEGLPTLYKKVKIDANFSRRALRVGLGTLSFLVVISLLPAFLGGNGVNETPRQIFWEYFTQWSYNIPKELLNVLFLLGVSATFFLVLDWQLKRRFFSSKNRMKKK